MNMKFRKTLIAGAIAALTTGAAWAADPPKYGSDAPAKSGSGQSAQDDAKQQREQLREQQRSPQSGSQSTGAPTQSQSSDKSGKSGSASAGAQAAGSGIYTRSADSLAGVDVVDGAGNKVGKVKQVVLSPDRKSAHAVIAAGGVLGMGARDVRVPLDKLTPLDDKLQWRGTKEQIGAMEKHTAGQFVEIKGNTPISGEITEFSAFEPVKEGVDPPLGSQSMPNSPTGDPSNSRPGDTTGNPAGAAPTTPGR